MSQTLYEAIIRRKSIRRFQSSPLELSDLFEIQKKLGDLKPLNEEIPYRIEIVLEEKIKGLFSVSAPYYLCIYSEPLDGYLENAGFLLQQMDLFLSASGIGSCWLGLAKPPKEIRKTADGLEFVIMLAFGAPAEPLYRRSADEFKRKPLYEISDVHEGEELLSPVRLAPSATNNQPWFFTGTKQEIIASRVKRSIVTSAAYDRMNKVDMGIALCHLYVSALHSGKEIKFDFTPCEVPAGYLFSAKAVITG